METFFCWNSTRYNTAIGLFVYFPFAFFMDTAISFLVLLAGCYAFELFSLVTGKGQYELLDVLAGMIGGTIGICLVLLFWLHPVF